MALAVAVENVAPADVGNTPQLAWQPPDFESAVVAEHRQLASLQLAWRYCQGHERKTEKGSLKGPCLAIVEGV